MSQPKPQAIAPYTWSELAIAVPAYARPQELRELLRSIHNARLLPAEVVICEDHSPDRAEIGRIAAEWRPALAARGCHLIYSENEVNLGYDGNVRRLFSVATRHWVMLLGNDDVVLPDAVADLRRFVDANPGVRMISRTFVRFEDEVSRPVGISRQSLDDRLFTKSNSDPRMIVRSCGFVGGLVIDREWALSVATDRYDGTLYYQIYLAALAFTQSGIGYVAAPMVGARIGNRPLFGSASSEKSVHVPGAYTPRGRASMWRGILRICEDVERTSGTPLVRGVRRELDARQSFHIYEMTALQGRRVTLDLTRELRGLGLMRHPLPWAIFLVTMILGRRSRFFFDTVRARLQR